jgi:hypothetical protein
MRADTRASLAQLALICFVVGGAVPRQAFYAHDHAGGGAAHSHATVLWAHHGGHDARSHGDATHTHAPGTPAHDHALHHRSAVAPAASRHGRTDSPRAARHTDSDSPSAPRHGGGESPRADDSAVAKPLGTTPSLAAAHARNHRHAQEAFERATTSAPVYAPVPTRAPAEAAPAAHEPPAATPVVSRSRGPPAPISC